MAYEAELNYLKKLLTQFRLNMNLITENNRLNERIDFGLRKFLGIEDDYERSFHYFFNQIQPNTVYRIIDDFFCSYVVLMLPDNHNDKKQF